MKMIWNIPKIKRIERGGVAKSFLPETFEGLNPTLHLTATFQKKEIFLSIYSAAKLIFVIPCSIFFWYSNNLIGI